MEHCCLVKITPKKDIDKIKSIMDRLIDTFTIDKDLLLAEKQYKLLKAENKKKKLENYLE